MKLKKIVENLDKMPSTLKGFNDSPKLSGEQKVKLMEMVRRYNEFGQKLKMENSLIETAQALTEISELAETYACNEATDWFATEVVKGDFKRAKNITQTFQKLARECHGKVQQLNALYEDMGHILGRYYEIADPMQEVVVNPSNLQSQRPLPNAIPSAVQEVTHNDKNIKSQRSLPSGGPQTAQVKEVSVNTSNLKGQRETPHTSGPAKPQVKEVAVDKMNTNIKGQRTLPSGGPSSYTPPKDKNDTGSVKETTVDEVSHNEDNLQSQRELPQGGPESYTPPKPENPSPEVKVAGPGEQNLQGQREDPQGGPQTFKFPTMKEIMGMK
jgi:hypothetical protein